MSRDRTAFDWVKDERDRTPSTMLRQAASSGRVSHAYLFLGASSGSKAAIAEVFAAALLCFAEDKPCGVCRHCQLMEAQVHPDCIKIAPDGNSIRISQVRALIGSAHLSPTEATRKVYMMSDAQSMTEQAANALLKLLEEPPPSAVFLLLAENSDLPGTIISRCQVIRFGLEPGGMTEEENALVELANEWFLLSSKERLTRVATLPREKEQLEVFIESLLWLVRDTYLHKLRESRSRSSGSEKIDRLSSILTADQLRRLWQVLLRTRRMLAGNVNRRALADNLLWGLLNEVN